MDDKRRVINSEILLNAARMLVLISKFDNNNSINLNKIMLYDFYMKFPKTMIEDSSIYDYDYDFYEFYSYYHWRPDREKYQLFIRYLLGKALINKHIKNNEFCYQINENGKKA